MTAASDFPLARIVDPRHLRPREVWRDFSIESVERPLGGISSFRSTTESGFKLPLFRMARETLSTWRTLLLGSKFLQLISVRSRRHPDLPTAVAVRKAFFRE